MYKRLSNIDELIIKLIQFNPGIGQLLVTQQSVLMSSHKLRATSADESIV